MKRKCLTAFAVWAIMTIMKKPNKPDINEMAFKITQEATHPKDMTQAQISQLMAHMGRKGGLKGGVARANALTSAERSEIARKAAHSRWDKKK